MERKPCGNALHTGAHERNLRSGRQKLENARRPKKICVKDDLNLEFVGFIKNTVRFVKGEDLKTSPMPYTLQRTRPNRAT